MNVEKINLNLVNFQKSYGSNVNLFINNKKIVIKTPIIETIHGIETDGKNKFYLRLNMSRHPVFVSFLRQIDSINRNDEILPITSVSSNHFFSGSQCSVLFQEFDLDY